VRAILVRVGVDQAYGGWNAPVDPKTGEFVFVPIPDGPTKIYPSNHARSYGEMKWPLADFSARHHVPDLKLPSALVSRRMHLDPDFEHLTYGDNGARRGARIASLVAGDQLVFYAGLRSIVPTRELIYALVGMLVVREVIRAVDAPAKRRHENAHTRWEPVSSDDVIVRGEAGMSGRLKRCIPIGDWRDKAYRVRPDIEEAWGGLSVKNGYIQRSAVPPEFTSPTKFNSWFQKQQAELLRRNN
jgi:hypothetical protein